MQIRRSQIPQHLLEYFEPVFCSYEIEQRLLEAQPFYYSPKAGRKERDMGLDGDGKTSNYRPNDPDENSLRTRLHNSVPRRNFHPTVKPLKLLEYLCRLTRTPTGGIVFDPFIGSGTTAMAAKMTGRHWFGCDISEEYVEIARKRVAAIGSVQGRLF